MRLLPIVMSDISERCYCASWNACLECELWKALICGAPYPYGLCVITKQDISNLMLASENLATWAFWGKTEDEPRIIPVEEWEKMFGDCEHCPKGKKRFPQWNDFVDIFQGWKVNAE
jgi:hypothetical protein